MRRKYLFDTGKYLLFSPLLQLEMRENVAREAHSGFNGRFRGPLLMTSFSRVSVCSACSRDGEDGGASGDVGWSRVRSQAISVEFVQEEFEQRRLALGALTNRRGTARKEPAVEGSTCWEGRYDGTDMDDTTRHDSTGVEPSASAVDLHHTSNSTQQVLRARSPDVLIPCDIIKPKFFNFSHPGRCLH